MTHRPGIALTICGYTAEAKEPKEYYGEFISLGQAGNLGWNSASKNFVLLLSEELENEELLILSEDESYQMNSDNVIETFFIAVVYILILAPRLSLLARTLTKFRS
jgi:hypothetical protein